MEVHPTGLTPELEEKQDDTVVVVAPVGGRETGQYICEHLTKQKVSAQLHDGALDVVHTIARSKMAVVVLTEGTLQDEACVLAMHMADAKQYGLKENRRVILLHDVSSMPRFPAYSQVSSPASLVCVLSIGSVFDPPYGPMQMPRRRGMDMIAGCFNSKALVYLREHREDALQQLLERVRAFSTSRNEKDIETEVTRGTPHHLKHSGLWFRLFLSHRQVSARHAVHRINEYLAGWPSMCTFLDVNATFDLHDLKRLVEKTHTMVVVLSEGYLGSEFCLLELAVALNAGVRIVWVRDFEYREPEPVNQDILGKLAKTHRLKGDLVKNLDDRVKEGFEGALVRS